MTEYLTREAILVSDDRKYEDVDVPEWGGTVKIRSLSGRERDAFETSMTKVVKGKRQDNLDNVRARMCQLVIVGENNAPLFRTSDIIELGNKSAAALQKVFNVAQELNGLSDSDVEELADSFAETPDESSTSG